jgi:hypothetical protein
VQAQKLEFMERSGSQFSHSPVSFAACDLEKISNQPAARRPLNQTFHSPPRESPRAGSALLFIIFLLLMRISTEYLDLDTIFSLYWKSSVARS